MMGRRTIPGFLLGLMISPLFGQTASMVSFQGLIKDDMGNPITVPVDLEFRIYDALTVGNLVDTDGDGVVEDICGQDVTCVPAVTPTDGIVVTKFGPIRATAFDGTDRFLEVRVDGTPLSRIEMVTAPAAAEQLNAPASGSAAAVTDAKGNVGIGTADPQARLQVANGLTILEQQSWLVPVLLNGWVNYGAGFNPPGYYKDSQGVVHLRGMVKNGSANLIFVLPVAYRPEFREMHAVRNSGVGARADLLANGQVVRVGGFAQFLSLDGITFRAAQ